MSTRGGATSSVRAAGCVAAALLAASAIAHAGGGGQPAGPAIVAVETPGARAATGFVAGGRVVTVAHAVSEGRVTVRGADGVARRATVVRRDASLDLAVLAVADAPTPALRLGSEGGNAAPTLRLDRRGDDRGGNAPAATLELDRGGDDRGGNAPAATLPLDRQGDDRLLLRRDGAAAAVPATVLRHIDARVRTGDGRLLARRPAIELRAEVAPGDSGAPLVGADGRLLGVLFAASDGRPGIAYAVDAAALERLLP